jgi:hypothetical protein
MVTSASRGFDGLTRHTMDLLEAANHLINHWAISEGFEGAQYRLRDRDTFIELVINIQRGDFVGSIPPVPVIAYSVYASLGFNLRSFFCDFEVEISVPDLEAMSDLLGLETTWFTLNQSIGIYAATYYLISGDGSGKLVSDIRKTPCP